MFAALLKNATCIKLHFEEKKKQAMSRRILLGYYIQKWCRLKCR